MTESQDQPPTETACPDCAGTGRRDDGPCDTCQGSGRVMTGGDVEL
jgi:DnaJ-class molecular chaperone